MTPQEALQAEAAKQLEQPLIIGDAGDKLAKELEGELPQIDKAKNIREGLVQAAPKLVDPETYSTAYDAFAQIVGKRAKRVYEAEGPLHASAYFLQNVAKGTGEVIAAPFLLASALEKAAADSPEAVAKLASMVPAAIISGFGYVAAHPIDAVTGDPVGTYLTLRGGVSAVKRVSPKLLRTAIDSSPQKWRAPMENFVRTVDDGLPELMSKPIGEALPSNPRMVKRKRVVGDTQAPRGRLDVPKGDELLKVGDILKTAAGGAFVGAGVGGVGGAAVGLLAAPVFRGLLASWRSSPKKASTADILGSWQRMIKQVSDSRRISEAAAKSHILSEAAKHDSILKVELLKINKAITDGDMVLARERMKILEKDVNKYVYTLQSKSGKLGETFSQGVSKNKSNQLTEVSLPKSIREPLEAALHILDETVGSRSAPVRQAVMRIAKFDSAIFGNSPVIRGGVRRATEGVIGRKLSSREAARLSKNLEQMAVLARRTDNDISGSIRFSTSGKVPKVINLSRLVKQVMVKLPDRERNILLADAVVGVFGSERAAVRATRTAEALERSAMGPTIGKTYGDMPLKDLVNKSMDLSAGSPMRSVASLEYAVALAESVIIGGKTVPMALPRGMMFSELKPLLNTKVVRGRVMDAVRFNSLSPHKQAQVKRSYKELFDSMPDRGEKVKSGELGVLKDDIALLAQDANMASDLGYSLKALDRFESSKNRLDGMEMHPELAVTMNWLNKVGADSNRMGRVLNTILSGYKGSRTVFSFGTGLINKFSNLLFMSAEYGVPLPKVITGIINLDIQFNKFHNKNTKGMSKTEIENLTIVEKLGLSTGDMSKVEIQNFLREGDLGSVLDSATIGRLKENAALSMASGKGSKVKSAAEWAKGKAYDFYSSGDTGPKRMEAYTAVKESRHIASIMEPGTATQIMTREGVYRSFRRKKDGSYYYNGKKVDINNLGSKEAKPFVDAISANARRRANDRYQDFKQKPGLIRRLEATGVVGLFVSPFITWAAKAKGIGGPNMINTLLGLRPKEYISNSPAVNAFLNKKDAGQRLRQAAVLHSVKGYGEEGIDNFVDFMDPYAKALGLGTLMAGNSPGMALTRNLTGMIPTAEASKFFIAASSFVASLFEDSEDGDMQAAADSEYNSESMASLHSVFESLGLTDNSVYAMFTNTRSKDADKRARGYRDVRRTLVGKSFSDLLEAVAGMAADAGIITDPLIGSYYDYTMRNVPKAQRPTRLHDFFVRQSGNLLSENTKLWSDNPLSVGNVGKLTRQSKKIQQRLIEVHFDPVSKKYGAGSQEALEAWTQIAAWNNKANERVLETLKKRLRMQAREQ